MSGNHLQLDYWPPAPGGAPGATQRNPVAAPLHGQNISNSPHDEPDSPFYPPPSTFMPPEDSPFSTALPSPAISSQLPAMYPQITYTSRNQPLGGTAITHGQHSSRAPDSFQGYGSPPWSQQAPPPNSFGPGPGQSYGSQFSPGYTEELPNQGSMLSANSSDPRQSSATEFIRSPGSQEISGDREASLHHAYPHELHQSQQQDPNYQFLGSYDSQGSSRAGNFGIDREFPGPQNVSTNQAVEDYRSRFPLGAGDYGTHKPFPDQSQHPDMRTFGNHGWQPLSMTGKLGMEREFPDPVPFSINPRGGAHGFSDPSSVASDVHRAFQEQSQNRAGQLVGDDISALSSPCPGNAAIPHNINPTFSNDHPQQRGSPRVNPNGFDERWLRQTEDMWNLATRRTSRLTVSPGERSSEHQENPEASAEKAGLGIVAPQRRASRFKALQLFDSSSEDSRQHDEWPTDLDRAYSRLGIHDHTLDESMILSIYFNLVVASPPQSDGLREALTLIAESRDSAYLDAFLSSDVACCYPVNHSKKWHTAVGARAAGEDGRDLRSATTISSRPERTLTAADMNMQTPEPSIGGDIASSGLDGGQAGDYNRQLSAEDLLNRAEARLASLSVAVPSRARIGRARIAKSERSSDEAEGGIRLDAEKTCYPSTLENPQQDMNLTSKDLPKEENVTDPYFRPEFITRSDASDSRAMTRHGDALAASLPGVPLTRPGSTFVTHALTSHGRELFGVKPAVSSVPAERKAARDRAQGTQPSASVGGQIGPANTQAFAPYSNQSYHPVIGPNGQMQWQPYGPTTMFPPPPAQHFYQPFPPQQMHFYGHPQAFPPHLMNYNPSAALQQNQIQNQRSGLQGHPGAPQQFAPQQFAPHHFAPQLPPQLNHQPFPQAAAFHQQHTPSRMPSNYGPAIFQPHLHPDPRIMALPPHLWPLPFAGLPHAEVLTRMTGDPARMGQYGPDAQWAAYHGQSLPLHGGQPVANRQAPTRQGTGISTLRMLPYQPGNDTMYPRSVGGASVRLQELTRNGQPSCEVAASSVNLPFGETAREAKPAEWGVVKIGNIPYTVTKAEILAHLGRNAKIITPDLGCAVHIIMDRSTAKTMDCFVEFFSSGDARAVVNKHWRACDDGRHPRLGDRHVDMEMSSQEALMKELFPKAKNVSWPGGNPTIERSEEPYSSGFRSFTTGEELVMMVKHAEQPHRSPYSMKCPQRTYECMISTLHKFPWWSVENYTLSDRNRLFTATVDLLAALVRHLKHAEHGPAIPGLTESLLIDLLYAGLNASGFSERQRSELLRVSEWAAVGVRVSPLAKRWPFEVLGRKKAVDEDVIEFYASLLASSASAPQSPLPPASSPFGTFAVDLDSASPNGSGVLTIKEAVDVEWRALGQGLRSALGG